MLKCMLLLVFIICSTTLAMQPEIEKQFQKELTQAVNRSNNRQEARNWIDTLKALGEYDQFFKRPTTRETIEVLLTSKFGPEAKPQSVIGSQGQTSLLGLLPKELQQELVKFRVSAEIDSAINDAKTLSEALENLKKRSSTLPLNNIQFTQAVIEILLRKFPTPFSGLPRPDQAFKYQPTSRSFIAKQLGAKAWLDEQAKRAPQAKQFIEALTKRVNLDTLRDLIEKQGINPNLPFNDTSYSPLTPIIEAAKYNPTTKKIEPAYDPATKLELITYLLQHNANPNQFDNHGKTPLIAAVQQRLPEVVKVLLYYGANPSIKTVSFSLSALGIARDKNDSEIVKLLEGALSKETTKG